MSWWKRRQREDDLERELCSHLELEQQEQEASAPGDGLNAAKRMLGNTTLIKEEVRTMWGWATIDQLATDFRYAARGMRKNPGFTAIATLSLALGIGATTAVFSVMNAVSLRPMAVSDPEQLVVLEAQQKGKRTALFNPLFEEVRQNQKSMTGVFAISDEPYLKVTFEHSPPAYFRGSLVSGAYFEVLGVTPAAGRLLTASDDENSDVCAAVISYTAWTQRFHNDPAVIGRSVRVREKDCVVVGVVRAGFRSHQQGYSPEIWAPIRPLTGPKLLASHGMAFFSGVMGRLNGNVSPSQAEAEVTGLYQRYKAAEPVEAGQARPVGTDFTMAVLPGAQGLGTIRRRFGQPLEIVLAVVCVVLLIAVVNVANLLLARGATRTAEFSTRAALGAGRSRLVRQLAIEGAMFATAGGLLGVLFAMVATPFLAKLISIPYIPLDFDTSPDLRVLGFALAATVFAAALSGLFPALRLSGANLRIGMAGAGRATGPRSSQRIARALVASQLALALLLVTSAGLLIRTMLRVMSVDPGFNASQVVLMDIRDTEPAARFGEVDSPERKATRALKYRSLEQRLNALPGVQSAAISWLGLFGGNYVGLKLHDADHPEDGKFTLLDYVSPRYFETIGMQVIRGRGFTEGDVEGAPRVAVVNEAFVRVRLGGSDAINRRFFMTYADDRRPFDIVGVVRDSKYNDLREKNAEPMMWVALLQAPFQITSVSLRIRPGTDAAVIRQAESALAATSADLMVRKVTTLHEQIDQSTARERLLLTLSSGFGAIALVLAAVGLYGTLGYAVARRTREIGVRLALGAQRVTVLRLMLSEALMSVLIGALAGIPLSIGAGYWLKSFLFGVTAYDIQTLALSCITLVVAGFVAALAPALRASRVDPMLALKYD